MGGEILLHYVHYPVLYREVLRYCIPENAHNILDCTTGEGGHSELILKRFPAVTVIGLDRDAAILQIAGNRLSKWNERFFGIHENFVDFSAGKGYPVPDSFSTVLIDLGISQFHYKSSGRGFSFSGHELLDMRLDSGKGETAADIINTRSEEELTRIFYDYAEERFSRKIAAAIIKKRPIQYTDQLATIISEAIPRKFHPKAIHPATRIFQALRIAVNQELDNIRSAIPRLFDMVDKGGRMGIITFHSLEDRIVKKTFTGLCTSCTCPPGTPVCICGTVQKANWIKKAVKPGAEEITENPASRSAILRVIEKII